MSSRISILNASVEDFALEVFASAPAAGSVGDHANGRIVKYGTHIYIWCDHTGEWKKFSNVSDFTSVETRLSAQEVNRAAAHASLEGIDSSLETRISSEESAMLSAVSSIETLAQGEESSLETRLSNEEVNRAADVDAEESRALVAEGSIESRVSTEEVDREAAVDSLEARASGVEDSLELRLSSEESAEASAEASLDTRISAEESARLAEDTSVATAIASAATARGAADTSLETRLSNEENRVDAILNASTADKDSFVEIVSFINAIDVAHDAQTSTEISSIDSSIASAEAARIADDSSLETRLSNEEDAEASAELSLNTRMAAEESNELSAEVSFDAALSSQSSTRLAEDGSLGGRMGVNESDRAAADTSLETRLSNEEDAMAAGDASLEVLLSSAISGREAVGDSLEVRLSGEESARASAVASEEAARIAKDASLTTRISSEEDARAAADTSLETRLSNEEVAREDADDSLELRLSIEESNEVAAKNSMETRISAEEDAMAAGDASVQTSLSAQVSTEKSRIDDILDSAAADKDTFVEIVSFITAVDTESDDALASYVTAIDSSISAEESAMAAGDLSLETELSSKIVERQSAITSLETKHSGEISALASTVDSVEVREESRHLRVDFGGTTPVTSFTVSGSQFPSGFEMKEHGMVQVFQDMGSNKFRHLVAPVEVDMSNGDVTVQLGSSAKAGFAVFYMFADDEGTVSAPSSATAMGLGGYQDEASTTLSGAGNLGYIYIKDYANQVCTTDSYGYTSCTTDGLHDMGFDLGNGAETKWYMRAYSASSPGSFSTVSYNFTGSEGGYGGDSISSSGTPAFPVTLAEGDSYELYAEVYDPNGDLIAVAGSSSAPYYFDAPSSYTATPGYQPGQYTLRMGSAVSAIHGQTVDVTVTVPSGNAGNTEYMAFLDISANSSAYEYGWDSYSTTWAASGTDVSIVNVGAISNPNGYQGFTWAGNAIPAVGTYTFSIVASANNGQNTTFSVTVIVQ